MSASASFSASFIHLFTTVTVSATIITAITKNIASNLCNHYSLMSPNTPHWNTGPWKYIFNDLEDKIIT